MKSIKVFLFIILILFTGCVPQQVIQVENTFPPLSEESYQLQETFDLNISKNEIFDKVLGFITLKVADTKSGVEFKDRDNGKIIVKNRTQSSSGKVMGMVIMVDIYYTLQIDVKENRIRLTYNNFTYVDDRHSRPLNNPQSNTEKKYFKKHLVQSKENCKLFSQELLKFLKTSGGGDNW